MAESISEFDNAAVSNPATMPSEMFHPEAVSAINKCQTSEARRLVIYDLFRKLINTDIYHIGGTYTNDKPDLWFYYSLSACPGGNFLLSLFACHRSTGVFSIGISEGSEFTQKSDCPLSLYSSETLSWQTYLSGQANENHYIKTFKFNKSKMETWENKFLCIPIKIETSCQQILNNNIVKQIKVAHDFGDVLIKQENTDFILESITKRQFPVHQAILAVHSPVLRDLIKRSSSKTAFIDLNDHDTELLLQFIYTGTIKDVYQLDCLNLLEIANKFQLTNLILLTQHVIKEQIDSKNAVEVAVLAEKYSLEMLQASVFEYIKFHPEILETEAWKNLNNNKLTKKFFSFMEKQEISQGTSSSS